MTLLIKSARLTDTIASSLTFLYRSVYPVSALVQSLSLYRHLVPRLLSLSDYSFPSPRLEVPQMAAYLINSQAQQRSGSFCASSRPA